MSKNSSDLSNSDKVSTVKPNQVLLKKRRQKNSANSFSRSANLSAHQQSEQQQFLTKAERLKEFHADSFFWRPTTANLNESFSLAQRVYLNGPGPGKYGRPSSIGCLNHDVTLPKRPAYTIGRAERPTEFTGEVFYWRPGTGEAAVRVGSHASAHQNGPGPGKYSRPSSIGCLSTDVTLNRTPAYSIGKTERAFNFNSSPFYARPKTPGSAITPGPAAYAYEKHSNSYKSSVPSYTIGKARRFPTIVV